MNIMQLGLDTQQKALELNHSSAKVVPFPTVELAKQLHAQGKKIVHKPCKPFSDDDLPPEAA